MAESITGTVRVSAPAAAYIALLLMDGVLVGAGLALESSFGEFGAFNLAGLLLAVVGLFHFIGWTFKRSKTGHPARLLPFVYAFFAMVAWTTITTPLSGSEGPQVSGPEFVQRTYMGYFFAVSTFLQLTGAAIVSVFNLDARFGFDRRSRATLDKRAAAVVLGLFLSGTAIFTWYASIAYEPNPRSFNLSFWLLMPFLAGSGLGAITWALRLRIAEVTLYGMSVVYAFGTLSGLDHPRLILSDQIHTATSAEMVPFCALLLLNAACLVGVAWLPARYDLGSWFLARASKPDAASGHD